jgi:inosine/xanthosine triphosphatase
MANSFPFAAIGSLNPQKVGAAEAIFKRLFPDAVLTAVDVPSTVSAQPNGRTETIRGAIERARCARLRADAHWGLGMESGIERYDDGWYISDYCCVVGMDGFLSIGGGTNLLLPNPVVSLLLQGRELGNIMDELTGKHNTKQMGGAASVLTQGLVNRQAVFELILICALAPLLTPEFYQNSRSRRKSA